MEMFLTQVKSMKTELRKKILMRMALMSQNCIKLYQAIANHITVTPTFENKIKKKKHKTCIMLVKQERLLLHFSH